MIEVERPPKRRREATAPGETLGGARLRTLRRHAGLSQLAVEREAEIGSGYLQRLESGKVAHPGPATLERILAALGARYSERRELLALFGYTAATPLPEAADIAWARSVSAEELRHIGLPAYVLDCAHRLIAWNAAAARLLANGREGDVLGHIEGRSLLKPWFDPHSSLAPLVVNAYEFLPALVRAMRYEMQAFWREPWCAALFADLWERYPRFRRAWTAVEREPAPAGAARLRVPVLLRTHDAGVLRFRLTSETFVRDARFRIVAYLPDDETTVVVCARWAKGIAP